jgi:hypothetical protein
MRVCPVSRDFGGMRCLDRDLPSDVYDEFRDLVFVSDLSDLEFKLVAAEEWASRLIRELDTPDGS